MKIFQTRGGKKPNKLREKNKKKDSLQFSYYLSVPSLCLNTHRNRLGYKHPPKAYNVKID